MNVIPLQSKEARPELLEPSRASGPDSGAPSFTQLLRGAMSQVNDMQQTADDAAQGFAVGEATSIHDTMIALEKADLSMRLLVQVRNKAIEAYHEVMRMQV